MNFMLMMPHEVSQSKMESELRLTKGVMEKRPMNFKKDADFSPVSLLNNPYMVSSFSAAPSSITGTLGIYKFIYGFQYQCHSHRRSAGAFACDKMRSRMV
jgi:hypothetical protein